MILVRYWPILLLATLLSVASSAGLLYLRKEEWMPPPPQPASRVLDQAPKEALPGMSMSYTKWDYEIKKIESLRRKLDEERALLQQQRKELDLQLQRLEAERTDLERIRQEIDQIREDIDGQYLELETQEQANLKQLVKVYSGMKAAEVTQLLDEMEVNNAVKLLALMPEDMISRILGEMLEAGEDSTQRAALMTDELRRIQR